MTSVKTARTSVRAKSKAASRRLVSPKAQTGASCTTRMPESVIRLAKIATPATASVNTFNAPVTAKVRSNTCNDIALMRVLSKTAPSGRSKVSRRSWTRAFDWAGSTRSP